MYEKNISCCFVDVAAALRFERVEWLRKLNCGRSRFAKPRNGKR
jgi:hypothetical protein